MIMAVKYVVIAYDPPIGTCDVFDVVGLILSCELVVLNDC